MAKYQDTVEYTVNTFQDIIEPKYAEQILADYSRQLEQEVTQRTAELIKINKLLQQEIKERKIAEQQLKTANEELKRLLTIDGLTQVANRRYFDEQLQQEWQRLKRQQQPLALILLDVDYFKAYNDCYGHQAGDSCLVQIAQAAKKAVIRPGDLFCRYGGEEFAVILPNTDCSGALTVAKRIQKNIRSRAIVHQNSEVSKIVSVSLGITSSIPRLKSLPNTLINLADRALYAAKQQGRDRYSITV